MSAQSAPTEVKNFDPNDGATNGALIPLAPGVTPAMEHYVQYFESAVVKMNTTDIAVAKSIGEPPKTFTFARMTTVPDPSDGRILPWPGIAPEAISKVVRENIAPQMIIGQRVDDVLRYSTMATQPWRPGWKFESMMPSEKVSDTDKKAMRDAETFLNNSNSDTTPGQARERDEHQLTDFQNFLASITRDTLTYDGIAIWTDADEEGKVRAYKPMPAGHIRLCGPAGYKADSEAFAVMVDEAGSVIRTFTRNELVWYVRNPRTEPYAYGYGYSEVEIGIRLIQGFQNALDLNVDTFNRNGIPNGILLLKGGGWVQRQVDVLARIWGNLKKGVTKAWSLPVIATPKEGDVTILNLNDLKGTDVRYQDHMNMMAAAFCAIYRFPIRRLGYRISGKGPDAEQAPDSSTAAIDDDDPGRKPLLVHIENVINQYLIWPRWPGIRFVITGKDPKEDARQYEALQNARTWGESRVEAGLPELDTLTSDADIKKIAEIMAMCPLDPNKAGVFQTVVGAFFKAQQEDQRDADTPGSRTTSKKDPAKSEQHGHTAGVRRDSRAETH